MLVFALKKGRDQLGTSGPEDLWREVRKNCESADNVALQTEEMSTLQESHGTTARPTCAGSRGNQLCEKSGREPEKLVSPIPVLVLAHCNLEMTVQDNFTVQPAA